MREKMKNIESEKLKENKLTKELCNALNKMDTLDVVRLLLDRGAEVNGKTKVGWTPLHHAAWNGRASLPLYFLTVGRR